MDLQERIVDHLSAADHVCLILASAETYRTHGATLQSYEGNGQLASSTHQAGIATMDEFYRLADGRGVRNISCTFQPSTADVDAMFVAMPSMRNLRGEATYGAGRWDMETGHSRTQTRITSRDGRRDYLVTNEREVAANPIMGTMPLVHSVKKIRGPLPGSGFRPWDGSEDTLRPWRRRLAAAYPLFVAVPAAASALAVGVGTAVGLRLAGVGGVGGVAVWTMFAGTMIPVVAMAVGMGGEALYHGLDRRL